MMARTVVEAETAIFQARTERSFTEGSRTFADAIGAAACIAAESVGAKCIVVYTASGYSAALISGYRPEAPIFAFSPRDSVVRRLSVFWGVEARSVHPAPASVEELIRFCERDLLAENLVEPEDTIAIVAGVPLQATGNTNVMKLHRVGEWGP
jgi:pyruvate kinase